MLLINYSIKLSCHKIADRWWSSENLENYKFKLISYVLKYTEAVSALIVVFRDESLRINTIGWIIHDLLILNLSLHLSWRHAYFESRKYSSRFKMPQHFYPWFSVSKLNY